MANVINATSTGNGGLITTGDDSGILNIQTNETTAITVDASQNVLVGTTTSTNNIRLNQKLAVVTTGSGAFGGVSSTSYNGTSAGTGPIYDMQRSRGTTDGSMTAVASGDTLGYVVFRGSDGAGFVDSSYITGQVDGAVGSGSVPGRLVFNTSGTERMRIDSSGNLLVGTTSNLNGSKFSVYNNVAGNYCTGYKSTKDGSNASYFVSFQNDANSLVGYIVSANQTGTNYTSVSDYRLKEDVKPMTGALDKVALLKPCIYKWKVNGSDGQGFIAHELAEVCPDAVTGEKDAVDAEGKPVYQGIDTSFLVATLTAAIQELKAINDTQAETINALTARIVALEAK
jgi:hypothetical protein